MSDSKNFDVQINWYRCTKCKRYYAKEHGAGGDCPSCAADKITELDERRAEIAQHFERLLATERRCSSALRGVIARLKRSGGK